MFNKYLLYYYLYKNMLYIYLSRDKCIHLLGLSIVLVLASFCFIYFYSIKYHSNCYE